MPKSKPKPMGKRREQSTLSCQEPKPKGKRRQQSTLSCQEPKQKLKQDASTPQLEQQQFAVVKQEDEEIAQLEIEIAKTKQQRVDKLAEIKQSDDVIAQLQQRIAKVKLKVKPQEEQETKSRCCKEHLEKPVGENQTGVPTIHSSKPVAGEREQPQIRSFKDALQGDRRQTACEHEKESMDLPLKKPHESFEHSRKNLTPSAEIPIVPGGEDQSQPVGSLGEKTEDFEIEVYFPERTNNGISEHENENLDTAFDSIALHQTIPTNAQNIAKIPCATPVHVSNVHLERSLVLREIFKATKGARDLTLIDEKIVSKLCTRYKDHNRKYKQKHAIHKHPVHKTVRTIYFLKLAKPSQSDFDSKEYREKHFFPDFSNGSSEYYFYNGIRGGDGDLWLKLLEDTARKIGDLEWQYFKSCELIARVNHEVHPVIAPEKLISYSKQHGFNCCDVDLRLIVEYMANSLMAKK